MCDNQPRELAGQGTASMLRGSRVFIGFSSDRNDWSNHWPLLPFPEVRRSRWDPGSKPRPPNHVVGLSDTTSSHAEGTYGSSMSRLISITQVRSVGPVWITKTFLSFRKCLGLRDFLPETTDKDMINSLRFLLILSGICHSNFVK